MAYATEKSANHAAKESNIPYISMEKRPACLHSQGFVAKPPLLVNKGIKNQSLILGRTSAKPGVPSGPAAIRRHLPEDLPDPDPEDLRVAPPPRTKNGLR